MSLALERLQFSDTNYANRAWWMGPGCLATSSLSLLDHLLLILNTRESVSQHVLQFPFLKVKYFHSK